MVVTNYYTFSSNDADQDGGAIEVNEKGNLFATGCTFDSNSAAGEATADEAISAKASGGGAIYNYKGSVELVDCIFTNNKETAGDQWFAAASGGGANFE
jgi:predicted outer membrane repeat protein